MSRRFMLAIGIACAGVAGCDESTAVDFFDANAGGSFRTFNAAGALSGAGSAGTGDAGLASSGDASLAGSNSVAAAGSSNSGAADSNSSSAGAAGSNGGSGGSNAAGRAGSATMEEENDAPCAPSKEVEVKLHMSVPLDTTGPVCLRVTQDFSGWGCSNFDGRMIKVNGKQVECAEVPLPDKVRGAYYFDISAGKHAFASLYWF